VTYSRPPARASGPNTASSIVVAVLMPTYRPLLRKPTRWMSRAVGVERLGIVEARRVVETDFKRLAGFGVGQIEQAIPAGFTIFVGPDLNQNQFVAEVGQVLQGALRNRRRPGNRK